MGNTVSGHICHIKVFRPYPVILYRLHGPLYMVEKNWCPSERPIWRTRWVISATLRSLDPTLLYCIDSDWTPLSIGGKKLVSLGTSKFGVLGGKATVLVCMHDKFPI